MVREFYMVKYENDDLEFFSELPSDLSNVVHVLRVFSSEGKIRTEEVI